jgi:hypothetical protein
MSCECNCPTESGNYGRVDELESRVSTLEDRLDDTRRALQELVRDPGQPHFVADRARQILDGLL